MQIYKIYINEKSLILHHSEDVKKMQYPKETTLIMRYIGQQKKLFQCIDTLEKDGPYDQIVLHGPDFKQMKADLKSLFKIIKAAGGLVINEKGEGLFIFRRGHWDLPKGKVDAGESIKHAAVREVEEETGVKELKRQKRLLKTWHVYKLKSGKRVLKPTTWYLMTAPLQDLIPQAEEQIHEAIWLDLDSFLKNKKPTYKSVVDVVKQYQTEHCQG